MGEEEVRHTLPAEVVKHYAGAALVWLIIVSAAYSAGMLVRWVIRGFKGTGASA